MAAAIASYHVNFPIFFEFSHVNFSICIYSATIFFFGISWMLLFGHRFFSSLISISSTFTHTYVKWNGSYFTSIQRWNAWKMWRCVQIGSSSSNGSNKRRNIPLFTHRVFSVHMIGYKYVRVRVEWDADASIIVYNIHEGEKKVFKQSHCYFWVETQAQVIRNKIFCFKIALA